MPPLPYNEADITMQQNFLTFFFFNRKDIEFGLEEDYRDFLLLTLPLFTSAKLDVCATATS